MVLVAAASCARCFFSATSSVVVVVDDDDDDNDDYVDAAIFSEIHPDFPLLHSKHTLQDTLHSRPFTIWITILHTSSPTYLSTEPSKGGYTTLSQDTQLNLPESSTRKERQQLHPRFVEPSYGKA